MLTLLRDAITNVKRTVTFVIARSARKLTLCRNIIKSSEEFSILIKSIVQEEAKEARGKEGAEGFSPQKKTSLKASNVPTFMDIAY